MKTQTMTLFMKESP